MNAGPGSCWSQPENKQNTSLCPKRQTLPLNSRLLKPARSRQPTHDSRLLRRDVSDSDRKKNVWNKTRQRFRFCCFHVKSVIRLTVPRDDKSADDSLMIGIRLGVRPQRKQKLRLITLICSLVQQEPALAPASTL